mmetsp:Transcript_17683/g.50916  ORF Transcript_17683/g.50916 Transcript_17683/m.50916 type:complete len:113 (-) Transcript_17683:108-446(-)
MGGSTPGNFVVFVVAICLQESRCDGLQQQVQVGLEESTSDHLPSQAQCDCESGQPAAHFLERHREEMQTQERQETEESPSDRQDQQRKMKRKPLYFDAINTERKVFQSKKKF